MSESVSLGAEGLYLQYNCMQKVVLVTTKVSFQLDLQLDLVQAKSWLYGNAGDIRIQLILCSRRQGGSIKHSAINYILLCLSIMK